MENRLVLVRVAWQFLAEMMVTGWKCGSFFETVECISGLPEGARLDSSFTADNCAFLVFSHPSFDVVLDGQPVPEVSISFRRHTSPVFKMPTTREEAVARSIRRASGNPCNG